MAETRAKARALRDAVNIGIVAIEELDEVDAVDAVDESTRERPRPPGPANGNAPSGPRDDLMTQAQRRLLFRIAADRGVATEDIAKWLEDHAGLKDIRLWSKVDASRLIERLKAQNGHAQGGAVVIAAGAFPPNPNWACTGCDLAAPCHATGGAS